MKNIAAFFTLLIWLCAAGSHGSEVKTIILGYDPTIAYVGTDPIYRPDVENRAEEVFKRLLAIKKEATSKGEWSAEAEAEWVRMWVLAFRPALFAIVRERLMIQQFRADKLQLDEKELSERIEKALSTLDKKATPFQRTRLKTRIQDGLTVETFRSRFNSSLEKEDEWFRAAYSKKLIMQVVEGNGRALPIDYLYPGDKNHPDEMAREVKKYLEQRAQERAKAEANAVKPPEPQTIVAPSTCPPQPCPPVRCCPCR